MAGCRESWLPERALGTARLVRVDADVIAQDANNSNTIALPQSSVAEGNQIGNSVSVLASFLGSMFGSKVERKEKGPNQAERDIALPLEPDDEFPSSDSSFESALEKASKEVIQLLRVARVPAQHPEFFDEAGASSSESDLRMLPVLSIMKLSTIQRFLLESKLDTKQTAVKVIKTAAWRGRTFPLNLSKCRIEIQSRQLVEYGVDLDKNRVLYFRTVCRGPWRNNLEASFHAFLHSLEDVLSKSSSKGEMQGFCLVVLLGTFERDRKRTRKDTGSTSDDDIDMKSPQTLQAQGVLFGNQRVSHKEAWNLHANAELLDCMLHACITHYPGVLAKLLFVTGDGPLRLFKNSSIARQFVQKMSAHVSVSKLLQNSSSLNNYINDQQLPKFLRKYIAD